MRYGGGTIAGFLHVAGGKIVLPKNLLPDAAPNVVQTRRAPRQKRIRGYQA